jgi:xylulose-5-phosphate/fructose-6-phosphate phosphoketolase
MISSKAPSPIFLSKDETERHCVAGVSVWPRYSTDDGVNPDVVLVGIGSEVTVEVIAAAKLLQKEGIRVRVVNVVDLMVFGEVGTHPHALSPEAFDSLFGTDTPVVFNFHGYPTHLESLVFSRRNIHDRGRFMVLGYIEQGTTTTPWSMLRLNRAGRFDVAQTAVRLLIRGSTNHGIAPRVSLL